MYIVKTFFTSYPHDLYNNANGAGNLSHSGVALGLINSQRFFWISNSVLVLIFFSQNYYARKGLWFICLFLYYMAYVRYRGVAKYLPLVQTPE
jgi:hypothetical protein